MATFIEPEVNLDPEVPSQSNKHSRKRRKKSRLIKQGYHKSERDDARRVAARAFLSGIPLDSQQHTVFPIGLSPEGSYQSQIHQEVFNAAITSHRPPSSISRHSNAIEVDIEPTRVPGTPNLDIIPLRSSLNIMGSPKHIHRQVSPVKFSQSLDLESPPHNFRDMVFWEANSNVTETPVHDKKLSFQSEFGSVHVCANMMRLPATMVVDRRLVFASSSGLPFAISSVISYKKEEDRFKLEHPQRMRARANSMTLQIDLEVELGTTSSDNIEVSLGFLFSPLWVQTISDLSSHTTPELTPPLPRKQSLKRLNTFDNSKRYSNPRPVKAFHLKTASQRVPPSLGTNFPWQFFRENHSAAHVISNYHPDCLDNYEYFVGNQTTTFLLEGKRVSIIQYARASDIKRGINDQFAEVFPYIKLTLSKLRSIKREMHRVAEECEIELGAVASAYVYFEKLILIGKINKANRKIIAGVCLLLAAKFFTDVRQRDIKSLVNKVADLFHLSTRELILYEFPVLVSLQFSLLTPNYQVQSHFVRLRDAELSQN